jgi:hypothetical protein
MENKYLKYKIKYYNMKKLVGSRKCDMCVFPGCTRLKFTGDTDDYGFCGRTHLNMASLTDFKEKTICIFKDCNRPISVKHPTSNFCGNTHRFIYNLANFKLNNITQYPNINTYKGVTLCDIPISILISNKKYCNICLMPGCEAKRFQNIKDIDEYGFCSRTHLNNASQKITKCAYINCNL